PELYQKLPTHPMIKSTLRFSGCTLFLKRDLFLKIGGFDESFFMYNEDTDLSLRFLRYGFKIYTLNKPFLIHQHHNFNLNDLKYYFYERNRIITFFKNINNIKKIIPIFIIIELILIVHSTIIKRLNLRLRLYCELLGNIKNLIKKRQESKKIANLLDIQKLSKNFDEILLIDLKDKRKFLLLIRILNKFIHFILK
ncbi:MAG: glycosyltransferase family 2 protein, partial [Promethearchaeota archaeon]